MGIGDFFEGRKKHNGEQEKKLREKWQENYIHFFLLMKTRFYSSYICVSRIGRHGVEVEVIWEKAMICVWKSQKEYVN